MTGSRDRMEEWGVLQLMERHGHTSAGRGARDLREVFNGSLPAPGWTTTAGVGVVIAFLDVCDWLPWLDQATTLLDAAEIERVQSRRFAVDRDTLVVAYALHRLVLSVVTGRKAVDVPLYRDQRGCPRLRDGAVYTSLSHADGVVAMAATAVGPVGIDLELATRAAELPEIAERVCHPDEAMALAGYADPAYCAALLALWVRKEALLKEAGVGLAVELDRFEAPEGLVQSPADGHWVEVRMVDAGPACFAAVAGPPGVSFASSWLKPA